MLTHPRLPAVLVAGAMACSAPAPAPPKAGSAASPASRVATPVASRAAAGAPLPGYSRGRADAPVVVVEFTDFGCRWCGEFARTTLPAIDRELVAPGRVRWVVVPVATGSTPRAVDAAAAAECAAEQQRPWAMHDRLFTRPREWLRARDAERQFAGYARELGLDADRFAACYRDPRTSAAVGAYRRLARESGVRVAPTLFVNGRRIEGALPAEELAPLLRAAAPAVSRSAAVP